MTDRIFLSPPDVGAVERQLLLDAFDSNWIAPAGPDLEAFEREVAAYCGVEFAVATSTGTGALHLALLEVGVQPGDEVLVPTLTFVATANAVTYCGATPVFIDASAETWGMSPELLEAELRTRRRNARPPAAVVVADLYGYCAQYEAIEPLCAEFDIPLVVDAAESLGSRRAERAAGGFGTISILSFNGNKILTTSGGGMVLTNDKRAAEHIRHLATQAREPAGWYEHEEVGFNYRLSNLLAALGRGQLRTLDSRIRRRTSVVDAYRRIFESTDITIGPTSDTGIWNHWLAVANLRGSGSVEVRHAVGSLAGQGIEARHAWKPMHLQPLFAGAPSRLNGEAEHHFNSSLCLPTGSAMSEADVERVAEALLHHLRTGE